MTLRGVLFDFDGTLTRPGALDFALIRRSIACPDGQSILEHIESLTDEGERSRAAATLDRIEMEAAAKSMPNDGAEELVHNCQAKGLRLGILTRNSDAAVQLSLANFARVEAAAFDIIVSRETDIEPKPSPDGVLLAARAMQLEPAQILVVGDFRYDIEAGIAAGSPTAYLVGGNHPLPPEVKPNFVIYHLDEVANIVRTWHIERVPDNL